MEINVDEPNQLEEIIDNKSNNVDVNVEEEAGGNEAGDDYQQILENNKRALDMAIQALEQARSDIHLQNP